MFKRGASRLIKMLMRYCKRKDNINTDSKNLAYDLK